MRGGDRLAMGHLTEPELTKTELTEPELTEPELIIGLYRYDKMS